MSEKSELCLACKKGHSRNIGVDTVVGEAKEPYRHTATMTVRK